MPDKLNGLTLRAEKGWTRFDRSYKDPINNRIHYRFVCSLKPRHCITKGKCFKVNLSGKYNLKFFEIISDERGKTIEYLYLGPKQHHPQKDPKTHYMCIGKFKNVPISRDLMPMLVCCILTYDQDDCFNVPMSTETTEIDLWRRIYYA